MQELDLNLLVALDALLLEQSVTRAAEKMNLSIAAMSRTLGRARSLMGDPLLVRAGAHLVPTRRALELQPRLARLISEARSLVSSPQRAPLDQLELTFTIRAEDAFLVLVDSLNAVLVEHAPKLRLRVLPRESEDSDALREGLVHLDIGQFKKRSPEMKRQLLFVSTSVGVARRDHPLFRGSLSAKRYASYRHVNASRRGIDHTPIDAELERRALRRMVALVVPSFHAAILAAANAGFVATIPSVLTRTAESMGLRAFRIPVPVEPIRIHQAWHPRFDADPAHRLVRQSVLGACQLVLHE